MMRDASMCAHCNEPILDPTTMVTHGDLSFCCPNCAAAMEESGSGSDPHARVHENDLVCAHCGVAIVDETPMESRGDRAYCCTTCLRLDTREQSSGQQPGFAA
ncbi:MAG: hypothetical protein QOF51_1291 [Chloroflexota bacterium]|jgi:hypothetical protein|nr:hypothetical protein [Chloroflexota bacterium]